MFKSLVTSLFSSKTVYPHGRKLTGLRSCYSTSAKSMGKSAGLIIIGDESLKGQTQDTNSHYLCQKLYKFGVRVKRISVIGDDLDAISSEVRKFSGTYDIVLTSGGIGPTHDDVTFEGIAKAFGEPLILHPTLKELCLEYFGLKDAGSPEMKLAHVPLSSELHYGMDEVRGQSFKFPLVSVKNVFLFPGIPVLLRRLIDHLGHKLRSNENFYSETLLINTVESDIATTLTKCANVFKDAGINVGSYPDWSNNYYKVKVVIDSANEEATKAAVTFLKEHLKDCLVNNYTEDPVALVGADVFGGKLKHDFPQLFEKIMNSMRILDEAFDKYPDEAICIGFNGGKDCTALLHLFNAAMCRHKSKNRESENKTQVMYVKDDHPFEELESFLDESVERYNLNMTKLNGDIKSGLRQLRNEKPNIKAVVMGTRATDPSSNCLTPFAPTDDDWPPFMRVNPILDWSYHEVWTFLRTLCLPYCVLYDRGYTSLGSRSTTLRNEKLVIKVGSGVERYAPAYTLEDSAFERNGRA